MHVFDIKVPLIVSSVSTLLDTLSLCGFHCTYQASWLMSSWKFYRLSRSSRVTRAMGLQVCTVPPVFMWTLSVYTVLTLQCSSYPLNWHFLIVIPIYSEEMIKIIWRAIITFYKIIDYLDRLDCLRLYFVSCSLICILKYLSISKFFEVIHINVTLFSLRWRISGAREKCPFSENG